MNEKKVFYDAHCHALTLSHPNFLAYIEALRRRKLESFVSFASSPNYLPLSLFTKDGAKVRNMLAVMENDVGSYFELVEDDLCGEFNKEGDPPALVSGGKLRLGGMSFDKVLMVPLIIDFRAAVTDFTAETYYEKPATKPLGAQIRDVLEGIRDYRRARPDGLLEIRPLLGVDPRHYSPAELSDFLEEHFEGFDRSKANSDASFAAMIDYHAEDPPVGCFAGVKVYPPLGFDPWPDEGAEREKVELLWHFCEERGLPVVTHCDDQGFRIIPVAESQKQTSPERWASVLEHYPDLRLDFGHFGTQYSRIPGKAPSIDWVERIINLMIHHPNVYADFSFSGSTAEYYAWLVEYVVGLSSSAAETLRSRLLFGTDFALSLSRVRSYADYYRLFAESPLSEDEQYRFAHVNPERFLFGA